MQTAISTSYRRDLGDGLVLRWSTAEDTERIATLHSMVHRDKAEEPPNTNVKRVIHRLMNGDHPLMGPDDSGVTIGGNSQTLRCAQGDISLMVIGLAIVVEATARPFAALRVTL